LILIPAHMLFMHLNYATAHEANTVIMRMQGHFIKAVDISLVVAILYHAGYGLVSFMGDYLASRTLRVGLAALVVLAMLLCAVLGVRLAVLI